MALPKLQCPVKKRAWLEWQDKPNSGIGFGGLVAGESALAHYTSLADTGVKQWAIDQNAWLGLTKRANVKMLASGSADEALNERSQFSKEREVMEIEVWSYRPRIITSEEHIVDPLSLWLSLANSNDERIQITRETLLEQVWNKLPW